MTQLRLITVPTGAAARGGLGAASVLNAGQVESAAAGRAPRCAGCCGASEDVASAS